MLTFVDNAVIVVIFIAIIVIAMLFSKTVTDMESYYLGNRSLPWSLTVGALVATWYGGVGTLGNVEYAAIYGLSIFAAWTIPGQLGRMPLALWVGPKARIRTDITIADLLLKTYGKKVAIVGAIFMTIYCMQFANITTVGFVGKAAWGSPYLLTGAIAVAIVIFIAVTSGLMGIAVSDMLLFWCLGFSVAIVVPICWGNAGGWDGIVAAIGADSDILKPFGGVTIPKMIMFVILSVGVYADPSFYQRFSSSDSPKTGRRALLTCLSIWVIYDVVTFATGLVVLVQYPDVLPGEGYTMLVLDTLPVGVRALFIVAIIGTAISALDGYFLAGATCFGYDVIGKLKSGLSEKAVLIWVRISVVMLGVVGLAFAFRFTAAMDAFVFIASIWAAAGFIPTVTALLYKGKMTPAGGMASMLSGAAVFTFFSLVPVSFVPEPLIVAFPVSLIAWFIGNRCGKSVQQEEEYLEIDV